jgi:uncharacterized protein
MNKPSIPLLYEKDSLWDLWCIVSIIGIWPRYIEPKLIDFSQYDVPIANLSHELNGLKVIHLGDTHFHPNSDKKFFRRVAKKINEQNPDLILFSGDFICYSLVSNPELLIEFFQSLQSTYGTFATFGNHDYADYASIEKPSYTFLDKIFPVCSKIFKEYFLKKKKKTPLPLPKEKPALNTDLLNILEKANVVVLNNEHQTINVNGSDLHIVGLGDLWANHFDPKKAFASFSPQALSPCIVICHNPDAVDHGLCEYPSDLILSGHTHGSQVNLPLIGINITNSAEKKFKRGWYEPKGRKMYITRGVSSHFRFRWFSKPELTQFTLRGQE